MPKFKPLDKRLPKQDVEGRGDKTLPKESARDPKAAPVAEFDTTKGRTSPKAPNA